ncbi:MAG: hypothetical protein IRY92_09580 [Dactylosporangium sp.]|nr:hypothetical protein [Dactylosporangium sp.]
MAEILRCRDQWGRTIVLTGERWQNHILLEHAELTGNLDCVRIALEDPYCVMFDRDFPSRENFYRPFTLPRPYDRTYLKVCVDFGPGNPISDADGYVVTAYSTLTIKGGETQKWTR